LAGVTRLVWDFETSGTTVHTCIPVGVGVLIPEKHIAFYVNLGHAQRDDRFPRYTPEEFAATIQPFVANPVNQIIAHNATFDLRYLLKYGVDVRCRVSDTLIWMHRCDENLTGYGSAPTSHPHLEKVTYGLKELAVIFSGEKPPRLFEVTGGLNAMFADIEPTALYCVQDLANTWFLYDMCERRIAEDSQLKKLVEEIDDPNNIIVAKMMAEGVRIDVDEAWRMKPILEKAIQGCREIIWKTLDITSAMETKRDVLKVMKVMRLEEDLGYDPFLVPFWSDEEPELTRDILTRLFDEVASPEKKLVFAAFLSMWSMRQRISSFINPLSEKSFHGRMYFERFSSTQSATRFSCKPNLMNLPKRADKADHMLEILPAECRESWNTRNLLCARPGCVLVSFDLSAAEPRYLAIACQQVLRTHEAIYRFEKRQLNERRKEKYPAIMEALWKNRDRKYEEPEIDFPDLEDDPLWLAFKVGRDPYETLLETFDEEGFHAAKARGDVEQWLIDNRWIGKLAFLAPVYGIMPQSLAPQLGWSLEKTERAIANLNERYPVIGALKQLVHKQLVGLGMTRSLWGRPRRVNGYHQLAVPNPLVVQFVRRRTASGRPLVQHYHAHVISVGAWQQGTQTFLERCRCIESGEVVFEADPNTLTIKKMVSGDAYIYACNDSAWQKLPFANNGFSQMEWVQEKSTGLLRNLPRQAKADRILFNAVCQSTGADHLRWLMNNMDGKVCSRDEFRDCKLILTVHDSLLFELPEHKWRAFIDAAMPILTRRPAWATIDIEVEAEYGARFGEMKKVCKSKSSDFYT
jgi:DNA polymerase I-like protein with 3'-5' exonuclease and polymerase domains